MRPSDYKDLESYFKEANEDGLLTYEEGRNLFLQIKRGKDIACAKDRIARCNKRLVFSIAKEFCNDEFRILDLISAGNEGLARAINDFDLARGVVFSTFATNLIRRRIINYIEEMGPIVALPHDVRGEVPIGESLSILEEDKKRRDILVDNRSSNPCHNALADWVDLIKTVLNPYQAFIIIARYGLCSVEEMIEIAKKAGISFDPIKAVKPLKIETKKRYGNRPSILNIGYQTQELGRALGVSKQEVSQAELRGLKILRNALE